MICHSRELEFAELRLWETEDALVNMGKYLNPVRITSTFMSKGGLARDCTCTKETCWECFDAIMGIAKEGEAPHFGVTKCGFDCAQVYEQNIPKRLYEILTDNPVLLTSERQIKNLPISASPKARRRRYRVAKRK